MVERDSSSIVIKGAREHNLAIPSLRIPKQQLVVFTGVSGSGKSSLAFDTLYAEGQRRYVESLSSYARQFLGQLDKPAFDHIKGLSPTIAIEQKAASSNPRSTVGTTTEIHDYLRVLFARIGFPYCPTCKLPVESLAKDEILKRMAQISGKVTLLAPLAENRKGEYQELFASLSQRGFARVRIDNEIVRLDEAPQLHKKRKHTIELVVDRFEPKRVTPQRLADSLETALREGAGSLLVLRSDDTLVRYGQRRACHQCGMSLPELSPQTFSFNSPLGMCPTCNGLGMTGEIDPRLLVPDTSKSIRDGAIVPLAGVMARGSGINFGMFEALGREFKVDLNRPWSKLPERQRQLVLYGTGDRRVQVSWEGTHGTTSWPMQFEGVVRSMMRRFRETKSEDMRRYYAQYMSEAPCHECEGTRLAPIGRNVLIGEQSIVDIMRMPVHRAYQYFGELKLVGSELEIASEVIKEIRSRLEFMNAVGLGYLSLDRASTTLSGGESQRIRLAAQLGSELSGVLYVLDEPSIGLHPRDMGRLVETLRRLRDADNTVIVVEHERGTIEAADHVIDFGPGAGTLGGHVVFEGTPKELMASDTLTGQYLAGKKRVRIVSEPRQPKGEIVVRGASENNLRQLDVRFPLGLLVVVTGVSGAGKSTLVSDILYPELARRLNGAKARSGQHDDIEGVEAIDKVILVDQSPIGRTPRSNPATYTKVFDDIREVFSMTPEARALGYGPGRFSFNVKGGRCEGCEGDGVRRVEMHFLPDVFVTCDLCHGHRYDASTLSVHYRDLSIADVLESSIERAREIFEAHPAIRATLNTLCDVGLGYVKLGQPAPTLSGGEAQRVKLSRELSRRDTGKTLYVLDEPTTGLHFDDVAKLLHVLNRLVEAGNTVVLIEHDLDVIASADHVIDLGPDGGAEGGQLVAEGTPEAVSRVAKSHTGRALRAYFAELGRVPGKAKRG
ncbi:MAG TPA: excinuclease ABC subunit UvrA [Polyangiaceae bacterium]|nr:excinuclease ABC subunit UvrA [Polyangiaceae bacterium]